MLGYQQKMRKRNIAREHSNADLLSTSAQQSSGSWSLKIWVASVLKQILESSGTMKVSMLLNALLAFALLCHHLGGRHELHLLSIHSNVEDLKSGIQLMSKVALSRSCSGHGIWELDDQTGIAACQCHPCFLGTDCSISAHRCIINLNQGDPTMFELYWTKNGEAATTIIPGSQSLSYYANSNEFFYVQTGLDQAIRSLHKVVGNAHTEGRHIVIGVGSTQLFQAALYALSPPNISIPTSVVSLAPYYSGYSYATDYLRSELYRWAGDAAEFTQSNTHHTYIELVTSPNNPTGEIRYPVVNGSGFLVHDLAYYWPHYTPITAPTQHDLMLFTVSKSTGHAGTRIGWAIVKDLTVAQKMAKFVELNTIGVSKEAQARTTKILVTLTKKYNSRSIPPALESSGKDIGAECLFHFGSSELMSRWRQLRKAVEGSAHFSLPEFKQAFCNFFGEIRTPTPAFAWLRCKHEDDCQKFLEQHGILTRGGLSFGADPKFVRLSLLERRSTFDTLIRRLEVL